MKCLLEELNVIGVCRLSYESREYGLEIIHGQSNASARGHVSHEEEQQ